MYIAQAISAKDAASLDKDLMDMGGWSLDQLMELAGLSVSQAGECLTRASDITMLIIPRSLASTPHQCRQECPRGLRTR